MVNFETSTRTDGFDLAPKSDVQEKHIPSNVKGTVFKKGYYLAVLCLRWLMRSSQAVDKHYQKIQSIAEVKNRNDIFQCLRDIDKGNARGKQILKSIERLRPTILTAGISYISDCRAERHCFRPARDFDSFRLQVPISNKEIGDCGMFSEVDYCRLVSMYSGESGDFSISNAITSLFTDIVLQCFKDCTPNLHITSAGSKKTFANMVDISKLVFPSLKSCKPATQVDSQTELAGIEPFARSASFLLNHHKYFNQLYLNDTDRRFYNFLKCVKEYPLYVVAEILTCDCDEELNKLHRAAEAEQQSKTASHDISSLVKIRDYLDKRCSTCSSSVKSSVNAAAWLFLWINMSFSGNFNSGIPKDKLYINNLPQKLAELLSAALVLQKADISCKDCIDFTKRFIEQKRCLIFADPPYLNFFGSACKTYSRKSQTSTDKECGRDKTNIPPFNIEKMKNLFMLLSQAKGKVLITHSKEYEVLKIAYYSNLLYLFSYFNKANGSNKDCYETVVFSKNITETDFVCRDKNGIPSPPAFINEELIRSFSRHTTKTDTAKRGIMANTAADSSIYLLTREVLR